MLQVDSETAGFESQLMRTYVLHYTIAAGIPHALIVACGPEGRNHWRPAPAASSSVWPANLRSVFRLAPASRSSPEGLRRMPSRAAKLSLSTLMVQSEEALSPSSIQALCEDVVLPLCFLLVLL